LRKRVLLVDSYDSFAQNIAHAVSSLGAKVDVVVVDDPRLTAEFIGQFEAVVLGPGPGAPHKADPLMRTIGIALTFQKPLLGICLGMQAISRYFGGRIVCAPRPVHGELSTIVHDGTGLFLGIPSPFRAMRYHSLCVAQTILPAALRANAFSEDGVIQGLEDIGRPITGVQFHPESFLSEHGVSLLANFLNFVSVAEKLTRPPSLK
jgi:anthranilate synthase/aminodeoxychorismate synthase-like glutamine amidotransferase